jgi:hypothetical protein
VLNIYPKQNQQGSVVIWSPGALKFSLQQMIIDGNVGEFLKFPQR